MTTCSLVVNRARRICLSRYRTKYPDQRLRPRPLSRPCAMTTDMHVITYCFYPFLETHSLPMGYPFLATNPLPPARPFWSESLSNGSRSSYLCDSTRYSKAARAYVCRLIPPYSAMTRIWDIARLSSVRQVDSFRPWFANRCLRPWRRSQEWAQRVIGASSLGEQVLC